MKIYKVGGAVRDMLLGLAPKDVDYVVVGANEKDMFDAGFEQVGAAFPVFLHPVTGDEYALARMEKKTGDGYHGFQTHIENVTLEEDLARRDLTINAMAMDDAGAVIDPYGGQHDLAQGILRHTGPAFEEDPLRVIRLARFYARYSEFNIAGDTDQLATNMIARGDLNHLPHERFWAELKKVFQEKQPERFFMLLNRFGAEQHVKFFSGLYDPNGAVLTGLFASTVTMCIDEPDRVMVHTALAGMGDTLYTAEVRTQALHKNIKLLRSMRGQPITIDAIFDLLKQARSWSEGSGISDMVLALTVTEKLGIGMPLTIDQLLNAVQVTKAIIAADYLHIFGPGKEIGEAIERGRKDALTKLFNLHNG